MTHADSHSKEKFADLACRYEVYDMLYIHLTDHRQGSLSFLGYIERASSFCLGRVIEIVTYKCINNGGKSDVTINPTCHVSNIYAVDESLLSILDYFIFICTYSWDHLVPDIFSFLSFFSLCKFQPLHWTGAQSRLDSIDMICNKNRDKLSLSLSQKKRKRKI